MFSKILIANRGEVAVRIIRACKEMGIETVAIYSTADKNSLHVDLADESYCIGGPVLKESYLNINAIITLAKNTNVKAIHPGYGMLSENPEFARECEREGIVFIGPSWQVIEKMGQKDLARKTAISCGIPQALGSDLLNDLEEALNMAKSIGYPVILKAIAGGGGKGIRVVRNENEMEINFCQVRLEAQNAFGDDRVFMEKFIEHGKHVEVQILADAYSNVVVLGDRDCSVQRKNQKLIEECPAPSISRQLREKIYDAGKKLAKKVGYVTVGTVEFLVKDEEYYFMEMNTRLQVEHAVTEMVSQVDIVKWQIRTAAGVKLPFNEDIMVENRHAIECRICAENPEDFTPSCGKIDIFHMPGGMDVRFDTAVFKDYEVPPFYDSMLGKMVVCSSTREGAIRKMKSALSELVLVGVLHNRSLHMKLLENEEFILGNYNTDICKKVL
ncbi:acetyl-CoA carboxylase, biotin carboxylase subunit [Acetitomaculum ruminis DSM 5522]|uniref:biotin carboxylase n=1 Tax=Acetitomaculum ruminis DSM 5522 TaxID=1120918 RepID=A0A1I0ZMT1_9FIRM|nr:acetyl-CoA carboxylase biotin carboxylase subunit [Acetitomaculum ruminis]SFB26955.1 acetyl-CoA carboxylase, biotin carboxylase subunit [Acetitomaculum ruminis DSM 5522]